MWYVHAILTMLETGRGQVCLHFRSQAMLISKLRDEFMGINSRVCFCEVFLYYLRVCCSVMQFSNSSRSVVQVCACVGRSSGLRILCPMVSE
jgi:hypothetical protein